MSGQRSTDSSRPLGRFTHVEFLFPEEHDLDELERTVKNSGVEMILFDSDRGDFARGERGYMCHPGQEGRFQAGMEDALRVAERLGAHLINPLAGLVRLAFQWRLPSP